MKNITDEYIKADKDEILVNISQLLKIKSITKDRKKNKEALEWVMKKAQEMGLCSGYAVHNEVILISVGLGEWSNEENPIRDNIEVLKRNIDNSGKETIGILAHVDVVPALGNWKHEPFEGEIAEGQIWGRGVIDDKGPLILCLHALKALDNEAKASQIKRNALMIIGSREEDTWKDIEQYNKLGIKIDFGFTPDGEFPVCNGEKGYLDIKLKSKRTLADEGYHLEGGSAANMVPDYAVLRTYDKEANKYMVYESHGEAAHTAYHDKGINAIHLLSEEVIDLDLPPSVYNILSFIKRYCEDPFGSELGIDSGEVTIGEDYFHRNVSTPTILSTSKKNFKLQINIRTAFGYDGKSVLKQIKNAAKEYKLSAHIVQSMDATMIKRDSHFIMTLGSIYRENTGDDKMFNVAYGASYAKAMPNIVSFGPIFPGALDTCHEINERVSINQLIKAGEIYYQSIFKLCL